MKKEMSLDEKIYELSCDCKESVYSNVDHREILRQVADRLEKLARAAQIEHWIAMQESMPSPDYLSHAEQARVREKSGFGM